ncbi:hypothetical protein [Streptomyces sp. 8N616]|uniref:hypothetical protein n=1 Tax=Streptomyces sp. 8N616 TaxID=3457414 RepID=UPI003FD5A587
MNRSMDFLRRAAANPEVRLVAATLLQAAAARLERPSSAAAAHRCGCPTPGAVHR